MQDISVLYLSRVSLIPGIGYRAHTHDYWHLVISVLNPDRQITAKASCWAPGEISLPYVCQSYEDLSFNVMFLIHDKSLYRKLEAVPFSELTEEELHLDVLKDIFQKAHDLKPGQEFLDYAFGYYIQLVLATYRDRVKPGQKNTLTQKAIAFIEENYMNQIRLEDVAAHIDRTTSYTSHLVKSTTGMTVVEHIREARIKSACRQLAYSDIPIEKVISACGFISESYFHKMFREKIGTTPNRYRTSHEVSDTFYQGEDAVLDIPYDQSEQRFTYIPGAQKCIDWRTPREYYTQLTMKPQ